MKKEPDQEALAEAMHLAVAELDCARVFELLARGVDADVWGCDKDYDFPLQAVARRDGHDALAIAEALIDAGADINHRGDYECTALARSIEARLGSDRDNWAMARFLIRAGANPSLCDRDRMCPAESANFSGNNGAVLAMLDAGMDANVRGGAGPLVWYCAWEDADLVSVLLARGANQNAEAFNSDGSMQTALQRAFESLDLGGDMETFRCIAIQLIQAGADPAQIDPAPSCLEDVLLARIEREELSNADVGKFSGVTKAAICKRVRL